MDAGIFLVVKNISASYTDMELTVCFQFRYNLWSNSSKSSVKMFVILRKMG